MSRKTSFLAASFLFASLATDARAVMCTLDDVPAATLLLPYFEVGPDFNGPFTVLSINNARDTAALAHLTFWTDWSQPTLSFDVYLTGYDVVTFNLYDLFRSGNIPISADFASDPSDTISPQGFFSQDVSFANCGSFFPLLTNPVLSAASIQRLAYAHEGAPVPGLGGCLGANYGDGIARGYLTIDSVSKCSIDYPSDPGYFISQGSGTANDDNVLWGDYFIVDPAQDRAFGERLVAIEADQAFDATATATGYTFYGRYVPGPTGADNREPLGTVWASRVQIGIARNDLIVWRDSTSSQIRPGGFPCSVGPTWEPLNETEVFFFDEEENATELCNPVGPPYTSPPMPGDVGCFPLETGRYEVGAGDLAVPASSGWLFLNLNLPPDAPSGDSDFGAFGNIAQSYVAETQHLDYRFDLGFRSLILSSACADVSPEVEP